MDDRSPMPPTNCPWGHHDARRPANSPARRPAALALAAALACSAGLLAPAQAQAQAEAEAGPTIVDRFWSYRSGCSSQDFGSSFCWSDEFNAAGGASAPGSFNAALVLSVASEDLTNVFAQPASAGITRSVRALQVAGLGPGWARLEIARGALQLFDFRVGGVAVNLGSGLTDLAGKAEVSQIGSGSRVQFKTLGLGTVAGSSGSYFLTDGTLGDEGDFGNIDIGTKGTGMLVQTGGTLAAGKMVLGGGDGSGKFSLSGGTAVVHYGINLAVTGDATTGVARLVIEGGSLQTWSIIQTGSQRPGLASVTVDGGELNVGFEGGLFNKSPAIDVAALTIGATFGKVGRLAIDRGFAIDRLLVGDGGTGTLVMTAPSGESSTNPYWKSNTVLIGLQGTGRVQTSGYGNHVPADLQPQWLVGGMLGVGLLAQGTLAVSDGTQLQSAAGLVGGSPGSVCGVGDIGAILGCLRSDNGTGLVTVSGSPTQWSTGRLMLGDTTGGRGSLQVLEGASVQVSGATTLGPSSTLVLQGGSSFTTGALQSAAGSVITVGRSVLGSGDGGVLSGTLRFVGGGTSQGQGALFLADTARLEVVGGDVRLSQPLSARQVSVISLAGGTLATPAGAFVQGTLRAEQGTVNSIDGPVTIGSTGRLEVISQLAVLGQLTARPGARLLIDGELLVEGRALWQAGTLLSGHGATYVDGRLALSDGIAQFSGTAALALMTGSVLEIDLGADGAHDRFATSSWVELGGTLRLASVAGYRGHAGDRFDLIDGQLGGGFAQVDTSAFALAPGLAWDFSQLNSAGVVAIQAAPVPEPGTWASMLAGLTALAGLSLRRRSPGRAHA